MLRSLGSNLVAKATPGSKFREVAENRAQMPPLTQAGQVGSLSRMQLEEPLVRQVPAGSQKIVSVQPSVEGTTVAPGITAPVPGVGLTPEMTAPKVPAGGQNQPLFQGGVGTPAGQAPIAKAGTTVSQAGGAKPAVAYQPKPAPSMAGGETQFQGAPSPVVADVVKPYGSVLGSKVMADEGQKVNVLRPTTLQQVAGKVGRALTTVGTLFNAPQLRPGGLGAQLQTFGGAPSLAKMGVGSVSKAVQQATSNLRSQVNNVFSGLRSLLRR